MKKSIGWMMALALAAGFATQARAGYTFDTTGVSPSVSNFGGSIATVTGFVSGTLSGSGNFTIANITDFTTTTTAPGDTTSYVLTIPVKLTDTTTAATNTITITGTLVFTESYTGNQASSFTSSVSAPVVISGEQYTLSGVGYNPPEVNKPIGGGGGGFSVNITVTPVPEPASMALLGLGGAVGIFGRRALRRRAA